MQGEKCFKWLMTHDRSGADGERQRGREGEAEENRERAGGFSDPGVFIAGKGESHTHTHTGGYPSPAVK